MKNILITIFTLFTLTAFAANVDTVYVFSNSMQKEIPVIIVFPESYFSDTSSFPSIYLLHGYGGDYGSWTRNDSNLLELCDQYNFVFICPDGNKNKWYIDNKKDSSFYCTFIGIELIEWQNKNLRTIKSANGRAICGISMGGFGAFNIALNNPEKFGAVSSISGVMNLKASKIKHKIAIRFGTGEKDIETLEKLSILNRIEDFNKSGSEFIFDCGKDDHLNFANMRLHKKLSENKVSHTYLSRPGKHCWKYFSDSFEYQLVFFNQFFGK